MSANRADLSVTCITRFGDAAEVKAAGERKAA